MADSVSKRIWQAIFSSPAIEEPASKNRSGIFSTDRTLEPAEPGKGLQEVLARLIGSLPRLDAEATKDGYAMDSGGDVREFKQYYADAPGISEALVMWYANQGFIGYHLCAILAQNWLINKACTIPARDALRNGYNIVSADGEKLDAGTTQCLRRFDKKLQIKKKLTQFIRKGRIFGCMIAIFKVKSGDPKYYEYPFNPDAIKPGSYEGITLVEPIWCMPELEAEAIANQDCLHFYEPTWWKINGKRYHRSHLCIFIQDEVADILKPSYRYGGVPIPQKIVERVYAAERTANEAPHLALTKRTTVLKVDAEKAKSNEAQFLQRIREWVSFRDNFAVKILDKDSEDLAQFDTTLADFDALMMSQYQLVAASSDTPATKLIGTPPKGFNATGEYEEASYHETLESIQEHDATAFIEKHHLYVSRSLGLNVETSIEWNPLDSLTAKEKSEIRKIDAETDAILIESSVVDAIEVRKKVQSNPDSGFTNIDPDKEISGGIEDPYGEEETEGILNGDPES